MSMSPPIHVLFLEDDLAFADLVQELLVIDQAATWQIIHVPRLNQARSYLQHNRVDVVLCDLHVPDSQGMDTLISLRQMDLARPVVVLTGMEDLGLGLEALRQGAQDYLNKQDVSGLLLGRSLRYAIERARNQALTQQNEQRLAQLVDERTAQLQAEVVRRKALFNATSDGIVLLDRHCRVVEANLHFAQMLGYSLEEVQHLQVSDWDTTWTEAELEAEIQTVKQELRFETRHRRRDGSYYDVEIGVSSLTWQGELLQLCLCRDISDRKQADAERQRTKKALQRSEARYRQLFEVNPQPMWVYDLETLRFLAVNAAAIAKYGYTEAEFLTMTMADLRPTGDLPWLNNTIDTITEDIDNAGVWRHQLKNGQVILVDITSHTLEFSGRRAELVLSHDITEQFLAEQALRASEHKHRALVEALPDLVMRMRGDGTYLDFFTPRSFQNIRPIVSADSHLFDGQLPQDLAELRMQHIQRALQTGKLQHYEQQLEINGELHQEEVRINPLNQDEVIILVRDITDRQQAEAALAQSEATNRAIVAAIPDLLIQMDREGRYNYMLVGSAVRVKTPQGSDTVLSLDQVLPPDLADQRLYYTHLALTTGDVQIYEQVFEVDGDQRDEEVRIAPLNPQEVLVIIRDITDRKQAERQLHQLNQDLEARIERRTTALRESESRFRSIFEQSPVGIAITDLEGRISRANPSLLAMLSYSQAEIQQQSLQTVLAIDPTETQGDLVDQLLEHTLPMVSFEQCCYPQSGEPLWVKVIGTCLLDGFGRPAGMLYLIDNITTEKATQAALMEISGLQKAILDSTDYAIISTDPRGLIQTFNAGAERMLDYKAQEVIGRVTPIQFHDPAEMEARALVLTAELGQPISPDFEVFVAKARQGLVCEQPWTYITRAGQQLPVLLSVSPLWSQTGEITGFVGIAKDMTNQRQAERRAHMLQNRLKFVLSSSLAITYTCQPTDPFPYTFISDNLQSLLGYTPDQFLTTPSFWFDCIHPQDREQVRMAMPQLFEQDRLRQEYRFRRQDQHYCWLRDEARLIRDEAGQPVEVVGYVADISDRKSAELALQQTNDRLTLANAELHRATRLKDEFLASMSHELRTPLNAILGMAEGLEEGVFGQISDRQLIAVQTIDHSGRHLLELINDILDLSKVEAGKLVLQTATVSVATLCESSLTFIRQQAQAKGIRLSLDVPPHLPPIEIDRLRMQQVLINLLGNAVKFTAEGGQVSLVVTADPAQQQLKLAVLDTGIGITAADLARLFQPFVQIDNRLNRRHNGTGLGLALVRRLVELHQGTVTAISTPNQGSCFTVTLPYPQLGTQPLVAAADVVIPAVPGPKAIADSPLLLLAEANDASAVSMVGYLNSRGYRVSRVATAQSLLDLAQQQQPQLILIAIQSNDSCDLSVIQQIRADPHLGTVPIIALISADAAPDQDPYIAAGVNQYLTRPVRLKALVTSIQTLLAQT